MSVKLLTKHHLESLSLKGGCTGCLHLHLPKCIIDELGYNICFDDTFRRSTSRVYAVQYVVKLFIESFSRVSNEE